MISVCSEKPTLYIGLYQNKPTVCVGPKLGIIRTFVTVKVLSDRRKQKMKHLKYNYFKLLALPLSFFFSIMLII